MDSTGIVNYEDEPSVDEGAFWHTNMDLYYGFSPGEIVEVEHESNKYWLARIQYCYKHLFLLKWVGNYGELWVDISSTNGPATSYDPSSNYNIPRRIFPLGHHQQPQTKTHFILERPAKILVAPSLYDPSLDPYANVRSVDDLLALDVDEAAHKDQTFTSKSSHENLELVCKKKIEYKQEDVDEVEAALSNLDALETGDVGSPSNRMESHDIGSEKSKSPVEKPSEKVACAERDNAIIKEQGDMIGIGTSSSADESSTGHLDKPSLSPSERSENTNIQNSSNTLEPSQTVTNVIERAGLSPDDEAKQKRRDSEFEALCLKLQTSSMESRWYNSLDPTATRLTDAKFSTKSKQFYDLSGINPEKVFVPGTLVEVAHIDDPSRYGGKYYNVQSWFAFVIKNTGGRLLLRWLFCEDPKFKQGRLELKTAGHPMVSEDLDQTEAESQVAPDGGDKPTSEQTDTNVRKISAKDLTFTLHFCHPRVVTIHPSGWEHYLFPKVILEFLLKQPDGSNLMADILAQQACHVFDERRLKLDKDRPVIDHILDTVERRSRIYLDLVAPPRSSEAKDKIAHGEVLASCPTVSRVMRAKVVDQLIPGIYEIVSEPTSEDGDTIRFFYPIDSSYAVLPLDWAKNNEDCVSLDPSRNPTPDQSEKEVKDSDQSEVQSAEDQKIKIENNETARTTTGSESNDLCLLELRRAIPKVGEYDLQDWYKTFYALHQAATSFHCCMDYSLKETVETHFNVMDQLEVVHPSSDSTICLGRIRKVVFPLLWIQLSADCFTVMPYNSTDIYPVGWCESHGHKLVCQLPLRKRLAEEPARNNSKKRKKAAQPSNSRDNGQRSRGKTGANGKRKNADQELLLEQEQFDLDEVHTRQLDFDFILQERNNYIKIYFNHKCFTGPSISKGKISSLPQYVGPGPMHLVLEEVVTKLISVAYVPPRCLNELCNKSFEELLIERKLTDTKNHTFKAKYQKRVHRERVPVCQNPRDIALYCACICEHLKCCYNLFGLTLYDGDDCPSHCRSLTKSNKFMKRPTYYREKARQGDYLASEASPTSTKKANTGNLTNGSKTSRPNYAGRGSSDSTNSSIASRAEQVLSRASSPSSEEGGCATDDLKESLKAALEGTEKRARQTQAQAQDLLDDAMFTQDDSARNGSNPYNASVHNGIENTPDSDCQNQPEFEGLDMNPQKMTNPEHWTVDDVAQYLDMCQLGMFKACIQSECIDGQALLLLDQNAIGEHFEGDKFSGEEVGKLCRFIEFMRTRAESIQPL